MSFVNNNKSIYFSAKTAFYIFWKLRDVFQLFHGQGERFWNLWMSLKLFENVLEMVMNSTNMNSSM